VALLSAVFLKGKTRCNCRQLARRQHADRR